MKNIDEMDIQWKDFRYPGQLYFKIGESTLYFPKPIMTDILKYGDRIIFGVGKNNTVFMKAGETGKKITHHSKNRSSGITTSPRMVKDLKTIGLWKKKHFVEPVGNGIYKIV